MMMQMIQGCGVNFAAQPAKAEPVAEKAE
jgi:hypothetical protein